MKMLNLLNSGLAVLLAFISAGCYYTQPHQYSQSAMNGTTATAALVGAAGGAYAGNQINDKYGAPLGAVTGGLLAGGATAIMQQRINRQVQEAYADGQRHGMSMVMDEWWSEHAVMSDPAAEAKEKGPKTRQIPQPAGIYDSVPYHKRTYPYLVEPGQ